MDKQVRYGVEEINGEKISWTYYYNGRTKRGYIKARYGDKWLIEDDEGKGFETALKCLILIVKARQGNNDMNPK